jgi:hypothetical protein
MKTKLETLIVPLFTEEIENGRGEGLEAGVISEEEQAV